MSKIVILYVEDDLEISENTQKPLSYWCDQLLIAHNGVEGLELYKQYKPNIVISDIKMPKLNGIEMVKAIKQINSKQHIIFTTAHSESSYFIEAIDMQLDGYILKPFDYDLLEEKIQKIIQEIKAQEKISQQSLLIQEIIQLQTDLLIILDNKNNIIFSNKYFLDFFNIKNLDEFYDIHKSIEHTFIDTQDFFIFNQKSTKNWIEQIEELNDNERLISIMNFQLFTPQAFLINIRRVQKTEHILITLTEITSMTIEKNILKNKAFIDELTQIYNRAFFNEELQKQIVFAKKDQIPFSLILFDIDKFKNFNDTYGHQIGDEVLKGLAKIIKKHSRTVDIFSRWGGEEFMIILPNTTLNNSIKVAEHLRKRIEEHDFINNLKVTCSFGVSSFQINDENHILIERVDKALYTAKENGRNKVCIG